MSTHKHFDKLCCVVLVGTLLLTVLFMNAEMFGIRKSASVIGYESMLFDTSKVHTINILMDNWDEFIDNCMSEEYYDCTVVIDNEAYKNVAIRGKGNTSLTQVASYGNDRYSFKIEFDHYDSTKTYYGLDKLCLNNIIQDNTYMKDYLTYQMMSQMGVASPLCGYVYITVNGEEWGLYLAVEGVEESFLKRNYGTDYGALYKPDSMSIGGGRGNGKDFDVDEFLKDTSSEETQPSNPSQDFADSSGQNDSQVPIGTPEDNSGNDSQMPTGTPEDNSGNDSQMPAGTPEDNSGAGRQEFQGQMSGGGMNEGSDDILLKYIDDEIESYSNIFDNAKTTVSDADKTRLINALKKLSNGEDLSSTVDVEAVIRYFVVHNFVLNFDSYTGSMVHNYYLYEKDGQMQMIPWDYNLAFGGFQSMSDATGLVNYPIDSPVSGGDTQERPMIAWIFSSEEYTALYHEYFAEFITEYFDNGYFEDMMDRVIEMISPYVEKDPTKFCTYEEFETGVSTLKKFCLLRAESISGQLDGTIGSTSDTQESDALIDAGDISVDDMGAMNQSMGGGGNVPEGTDGAPEGTMPQSPSENENVREAAPPDGSQGGMGDGTENIGGPGSEGDSVPGDMGQITASEQKAIPAASWIWVIASAAILASGLCFAALYRRRKSM